VKGNPYGQNLEEWLVAISRKVERGETYPNDGMKLGLEAQAALAVAFEKRTANLIAYQANVEASYTNERKNNRSAATEALNKTIMERLGLD
jgi:hypothetical protein